MTVLAVLAVLAVAVAAVMSGRKAASARFMAEIEEFGLSRYHREICAERDSAVLQRRYLVFVGILGVMRELKEAGPGSSKTPGDPVEQAACEELCRLGILRRNPDGASYRRA